MPSLGRTLQDYDLGRLRLIAELWGIDAPPRAGAEAAADLARQMLDPGLAAEVAQTLPAGSRSALDYLLERGGRAAMAELSLRFGPLRIVGPGRRDRERRWRDPDAALEGLWYRGLIGLAFYDTPTGPQEFAVIPDDLLQLLRPLVPAAVAATGSPAPQVIREAGGAADDAVTLLASLRRRPARRDSLPADRSNHLKRYLLHPESLALLVPLLLDAGVLARAPLRPDPAKVRLLLGQSRRQVEASLLHEWQRTHANDLDGLPGLVAPKGKWPNDPVASRTAALIVLAEWASDRWYSLEQVVGEIQERHPAFLRPGGDFQSWYLQEANSGRFLRGAEDWHLVEGALLRYAITGPLHWLGAADLGHAEGETRPTHFRLRHGLGAAPLPRQEPDPPAARLSPDGRILFPSGSSLTDRYQVARFAEWVERDSAGYLYRISPRALSAAASQGLEVRRVAALLEKACRRPMVASLRRAIDRWAERGAEAALESTTILRVRHPAILRQLRADPAAGRLLEEILGPTAARIRRRDAEALLAAAARRGLLIEPPEEQ